MLVLLRVLGRVRDRNLGIHLCGFILWTENDRISEAGRDLGDHLVTESKNHRIKEW